MANRVLFVTLHHWRSHYRLGMHWLADTFHRKGWEVVFMTVCASPIKRFLGRDRRLCAVAPEKANRLARIKENYYGYLWQTPWHPPAKGGWLKNLLSAPLIRMWPLLPLGEVRSLLPDTDLAIFDSHVGILLMPRIRSLAPNARMVYRASDHLYAMGVHPAVVRFQQRIASQFDRISCPSEAIFRQFDSLGNARVDHHGLSKSHFDRSHPDPYDDRDRPVAVFVGNVHVDLDLLARACRQRRDIAFHVIGRLPDLPDEANLVKHGSLPFAETVPFIQHADIGLHCIAPGPACESFTDSLKVLQYTYCKLPIVAPEFLRCERQNFVFYHPGDDASIRQALGEALQMDRSTIDPSGVESWEDLAAKLAGQLEL